MRDCAGVRVCAVGEEGRNLCEFVRASPRCRRHEVRIRLGRIAQLVEQRTENSKRLFRSNTPCKSNAGCNERDVPFVGGLHQIHLVRYEVGIAFFLLAAEVPLRWL